MWAIDIKQQRKRSDRRHFKTAEQIPLVVDAERIVRVAELGDSSTRAAEVDPFYDPLEDTLEDLASEWSGASEDEDRLVWGE